jgi:hypothetical protein
MRFSALIIVFCVLLQGFSKSILLVCYQLNKKYYSEVLCTNKGLVVIDCEGKCKLLKDVEEEEKRSTNIPGKETIDISVLPPVTGFEIDQKPITRCCHLIHLIFHLLDGWISSLHKPPRLFPV